MARALLDANILVYAFCRQDRGKQRLAADLIRRLAQSRTGALSTQTLAEFYRAATRALPDRLPPALAQERLRELGAAFPVHDITLPLVLEAARGAAEHQMSYWDAQVWATAKLNQIPYILTENMQGHETLEGVRFLNPLSRDFDLQVVIRRRG